VWSVDDSATVTGAAVSGNTLSFSGTAGSIDLVATIANGTASGAAYTQNFRIVINTLANLAAGINTITAADSTAGATTAKPILIKISGSISNYETGIKKGVTGRAKFVALDLSGCLTTLLATNGFRGFTYLCSLVFPDVQTTVYANSFMQSTTTPYTYCENLTSITLPPSVTSFADSAFRGLAESTGTRGLTNEGAEAILQHIVDYFPNKTVPTNLFFGCTVLTEVNVPYGITALGSTVFQNCTGLTTVTLPATVTSMGALGAANLSSATLQHIMQCVVDNFSSKALTQLAGLSSLTTVTVPSGITSVNFKNCTNLTSVSLPASVTSIAAQGFLGCTSLTNTGASNVLQQLANANGVLPDYLFSGCTSLTSVILPSGITAIGNNAFSGCTNLASVSVPTTVVSVGTYAFQNIKLSNSDANVILQRIAAGSSKAIPTYLFSGCTLITSVTIPEGITSIGNSAFASTAITSAGAEAILQHIVDHCSVKAIPVGLFSYNTSLTSVIVPSGITSIEGTSFSGCTSLASVTLPASVELIKAAAFQTCSVLNTLILLGSSTALEAVSAFTGSPFSIAGESDRHIYVPSGSIASYYGTAANWKNSPISTYITEASPPSL
jgi:hypothetical protein